MRGSRFLRGAVVLYLFVGCGPEDCVTVYSPSSGASSSSGGCEGPLGPVGCGAGTGPNGGLGQGDFSYVCPSAAGAGQDAWCDLHGLVAGELLDASDADLSDAAGAVAEFNALGGADAGAVAFRLAAPIPDVAVGAAFQLSYAPISPAENLGPPTPALASLAEAVPLGTALAASEWAGYIVRQGATVFDYTHVRARPVVSLRLSFFPASGGPSALPAGSTTIIAALPLAEDGTVLAGAFACSFDSSDASVATVAASGRTASLVSLRSGQVTLTVSCLGVQTRATVAFPSPSESPEGGMDASLDDASAPESSAGGDDGPVILESGGEDVATDAPESDAGEGG